VLLTPREYYRIERLRLKAELDSIPSFVRCLGNDCENGFFNEDEDIK
jgi:hypothetical protein